MHCKIADLIVDIPEAGGLPSRCGEYQCNENVSADIIICADKYKLHLWPELPEERAVYMESGKQFYRRLLENGGMMLHASAVALDGKGYLFSGPSGVGKSTHTKLWQRLFEGSAQVFNDDKPALRLIEDRWYAYGTPWCGKDGININMKVPVAGICFLRRGEINEIRRLTEGEAMKRVIAQTLRRFGKAEGLDRMLTLVDRLVREIPIYELACTPDMGAAQLSYETMRRGAEEIGL